jgi:hypothetical protein
LDLFDDLVGGFGPDERRRVFVGLGEVGVDRGGQARDRREGAAADRFVGELGEEPLEPC